MAIIPPNPTQGQALFLNYSGLLEHDDFCDSKQSGVYLHKASEFSATECEMILDVLRYTIDQVKLKAEYLSDLQDVSIAITSLGTGDTIVYNSSTGKWENKPSTSTDQKVAADNTDLTPGHLDAKVDNSTIEVNATAHALRIKALGIANAQISNSAAISWSKINPSGAVWAAGDITSGQLAVARGGTNASTPADAQTNLQFKTVVPSSSGPVNVLVTDTYKFYTNEGAGAEVEFLLPTAAAGLVYYFYCADADGAKIRANTGDKVRVGASLSSSAGYALSTTIGSAVMMVAINADEWVAMSSVGTWSTS